MKTKARLFGLYLPFFALLMVGAVALRSVALFEYFDYDYGYFTGDTLPLIANILTCALIFMSVIYVCTIRAKLNLIPSFSSPANYIPSAAITAALAFIIYNFGRTFFTVENQPIKKWFSLILAILGIFSIIHFIFNTIFVRTVSARRAGLGFFTVFFLCLYVVYLYMDNSTPVNSPVKTVDEMAYLFAAIFFLYEIRLSLGREKWRCYAAFGYISALLTAYSSIPALIVYFAKGEIISDSIYESILTFTLFLFITLKLILMERLTDSSEAPIITELKQAAERRENELHPIPEEAEVSEEADEQEEPDENQISILEIQELSDTQQDSLSEADGDDSREIPKEMTDKEEDQ